MDITTTTNEVIEARKKLADATITLMEAERTLDLAKAKLVLEDAEYMALKNEGQRSAYVQQKLGEQVAAIEGLKAGKVIASTELAIAEDKVRCAKYLIIASAGKLVA